MPSRPVLLLLTTNVWGQELNRLRKWSTEATDVWDLQKRIVKSLPKGNGVGCYYTLSKLWIRRNTLIFDNQFDQPKMVIQQALSQLKDYQSAQQTHKDTNPIEQQREGDKEMGKTRGTKA